MRATIAIHIEIFDIVIEIFHLANDFFSQEKLVVIQNGRCNFFYKFYFMDSTFY